MNKILTLYMVFFALFFGFFNRASAQEKIPEKSQKNNSTARQERGRNLSKVIFVPGWDISALKNIKPIKERLFEIGDYAVSVKTHELPQLIETKLDYHGLDKNGDLVFNTLNVEYSGGTSYSLNGKTLGYRILYGIFNFSEKGKKTYGEGPPIKYYYCDEDGDGKFETRYLMNGDPEKIPAWVTKDKTR